VGKAETVETGTPAQRVAQEPEEAGAAMAAQTLF